MPAEVHFELVEGTIDPFVLLQRVVRSTVGAVVTFDGLVRDHNDGHYVKMLEYQAYPVLALRVGKQILLEELERHKILSAIAVHRVGSLEIGDRAVWLAVAAEHRREAFAAAEAIMERLKYELPVWKKETYADGSVEWVGPDQANPLTGIIDDQLAVWKADLKEIWISPGNDFRGRHGMERAQNGVIPLMAVECVAGMGLRGDRYFGYKPDYKGQVTFFEADVTDQVKSAFGLEQLCSSVFRRNLMVSGVRLRDWVGRRFVFQGVEFEGTEECKPCYWMDKAVASGVEDFMKIDARGGLRARILSNGTLRCLTECVADAADD